MSNSIWDSVPLSKDIMHEIPNPIKNENIFVERLPVIPIFASPSLAREIKVSPSGKAFPMEMKTLPK
jgi:hypothetical protein